MLDRITPKEAREAAGLTRKELADRGEIGLSTVIKAEQRARWPERPTTLARYLRALGTLASASELGRP